MEQILKHFRKISQIPHCSGKTEALQKMLVEFAKEQGYEVQSDRAKNILITSKQAKLTLQAHYDMVCVGRAPEIEIETTDGIMRAKDSSLGADNGMAIAMMMSLMEQGAKVDFLLTNDEEIGLIGANNLELELNNDYLLNLDSEQEAEVYIGCAGGADIHIGFRGRLLEAKGRAYELKISKLPGGHSGVDIDKSIPSALEIMASYLSKNKLQLSSIVAGERINAIASNAVAVVVADNAPEPTEQISVRQLSESPRVLSNSKEIVGLLGGLRHGVWEYNEQMQIPHTSSNLALAVANEQGDVDISVSLRAMDDEALEAMIAQVLEQLKGYECSVEVDQKYPAWSPQANELSRLCFEVMSGYYPKVEYKAIHAGLECGVLSRHLRGVKFASIGPTIRYPHSNREEVDLQSVKVSFEVIRELIARL